MRYYKHFLLAEDSCIVQLPQTWQEDKYIVLQTAANGIQTSKIRSPRGAKRMGGGKYR